MPLTDTARKYVRSRIGVAIPPADVDLDASYDETGLAAQVALDVLEGRLQDLLDAGPGSYNVSGVYQEDYTAVINGLKDKIARVTVERDSERKTIAAGIDPWAPVTEDNPGLIGANVTVGQAQRAPSAWDRC